MSDTPGHDRACCNKDGTPKNSSALETYLAGVNARALPVCALDGAVVSAHPEFDLAVKYKILMYALRGDWRTWVCAIDATKTGVCLPVRRAARRPAGRPARRQLGPQDLGLRLR